MAESYVLANVSWAYSPERCRVLGSSLCLARPVLVVLGIPAPFRFLCRTRRRCRAIPSGRGSGFGGPLRARDVDLAHGEHLVHHPLRPGAVGVGQQLEQPGRYDLPGQAELVLEPATPALLTAVRGQRRPP